MPDEAQIKLIQEIYQEIFGFVKEGMRDLNIKKFSLEIYGSTANGMLVKNSSDLDLTLISMKEGGLFYSPDEIKEIMKNIEKYVKL